MALFHVKYALAGCCAFVEIGSNCLKLKRFLLPLA
jgi:hypothetical protein